jgi:hypothetical protein
MTLIDSMNLRRSSAHALNPANRGSKMVQHDADRVCEAPECTTRLSRYNPAASCSAHAGWTDAGTSRRAGS